MPLPGPTHIPPIGEQTDPDKVRVAAVIGGQLASAPARGFGLTPEELTAVQAAAAGAYQPLDAGLTDLASLAVTDGNVIVGSGTNWITESGDIARTSLAAFGVVRVQAFTSSGTYTPHANMLACIIEAVGGGGAGGGVTGTATHGTTGSGGGGGAYSRKICARADVGASKTVTIGAGGVHGGAGSGGAGGDTSLGSLCVAKGGAGGSRGQSGVAIGEGGAGGAASGGTGDVRTSGGSGGGGMGQAGGTFYFCGWGGAPGSGGGGIHTSLNVDGNAGVSYGGGGSAAQDISGVSRNGGNGAGGIVLVTEFCSQ